jgi:hypothetical protein
MDHSKIEQLTGLQRKIDYDFELDQVMEEDIDQMVNLCESLSDEEEQELWRQIKQKHGDIPDDDIVEFVKNKLISEGLS